RLRLAKETGKKIVELVKNELTPAKIMTKEAIDNGIRALLAVGGSTNAVIHLIAIARRLGIPLELKRFNELSKTTPLLANLRPAGEYQMEDFYHAGGVPALLKEMASLLHLDVMTVTGTTLRENLEQAEINPSYRHIIKSMESPLYENGALKVVYGNLAPNGAVIKPKAV